MSRTRSFRFPTRTGALLALLLGGSMLRRVLPVVYVLIGAAVAAEHNYLASLSTAGRVLSAALAILLWPLVLLGVHPTIN
jgi:ABC-type transporter Mla MlaB component